MTRKRAEIVASLADRGRPELWANEDEAAVLSGMDVKRFRAHLTLLEGAGFPRPSAWNGLRFIPAIIAFWHKENGLDSLLEPAPGGNHESDGTDKWGTNDRQSQRRPS